MNTSAPNALSTTQAPSHLWLRSTLPVLTLLLDNSRAINLAAAASFMVGLLIGWAVFRFFGFPLWLITLIVLLALLPVGIVKWSVDRARYGKVVMVVSILLVTQGTHTIEHLTQFFQYYVVNLPARQSNGLLSPANSEIVHFVWNWAVLIVVIFLIRGGFRNLWAYLLLVVAMVHTLEHTYMFVRYLIVLQDLASFGITTVTAQGLPGILGRDGWLARSPLTHGTFLAILPGLTTAMRLDVHFWWNAIEMTLLLSAAHVYLPRWLVNPRKQP